ncbi:hypothetical protein LINPERPRIM_LOCUS8802, partial [Linum perenne]
MTGEVEDPNLPLSSQPSTKTSSSISSKSWPIPLDNCSNLG